jgi:hypothetical protein
MVTTVNQCKPAAGLTRNNSYEFMDNEIMVVLKNKRAIPPPFWNKTLI